MTSTRYKANGPIFRHFAELSKLPPSERREALMLRLEHVWDEAQAKCYVNKHGDEIPMPDGTLQLKVIQAVAVLQGLTGQAAEGDAANLERMSDADLVREATKRLPPHEVNALADQLIAMREQQNQKQAILTTGETNDEPATEPERTEEVEPDSGSFPSSGPGWT